MSPQLQRAKRYYWGILELQVGFLKSFGLHAWCLELRGPDAAVSGLGFKILETTLVGLEIALF